LTAKPVQLPTTTGVFLILLPNSSVSSTTCACHTWVSSLRTTTVESYCFESVGSRQGENAAKLPVIQLTHLSRP
jgi:hypothetical protein